MTRKNGNPLKCDEIVIRDDAKSNFEVFQARLTYDHFEITTPWPPLKQKTHKNCCPLKKLKSPPMWRHCQPWMDENSNLEVSKLYTFTSILKLLPLEFTTLKS